MTKHRYTQSKPTVPDSKTTEADVNTDGSVIPASEITPVECVPTETKALDGKLLNQELKVVEVDTNEILVALLDQFKRINSVLEKQSQAQIQQAATLMQLTDGIKAINDRLKKPSFV